MFFTRTWKIIILRKYENLQHMYRVIILMVRNPYGQKTGRNDKKCKVIYTQFVLEWEAKI